MISPSTHRAQAFQSNTMASKPFLHVYRGWEHFSPAAKQEQVCKHSSFSTYSGINTLYDHH